MFSVPKLFRHVANYFATRRHRTREDLEKNTDLIFVEPLMESCEVLLMENGNFVGATGTINASHIVEPSPLKRPDNFDPKFNERESELVRVAAATCQIVTLDSTGRYLVTGTAFFIGPNTLLTAGHTISSKSHPVYTQGPGIESTKSPKAIYNAAGVSRLTLHVRSRIGDGTGPTPDLAILEIKSYTYGSPLEILWDAQLIAGNTVDVIGYPGTYTEDYIEERYKQQVSDIQVAHKDAQSLLPQRTLSVSCGKLISGGDKPEYRLSTFGGMSGSPVVYQGKIVGVHTGVNDKTGENHFCALISTGRVKQMVEIALKYSP